PVARQPADVLAFGTHQIQFGHIPPAIRNKRDLLPIWRNGGEEIVSLVIGEVDGSVIFKAKNVVHAILPVCPYTALGFAYFGRYQIRRLCSQRRYHDETKKNRQNPTH